MNDPLASASPSGTPEGEVKMTIWEHLAELRVRIIRSCIAVLATTIVAWAFREQILAGLRRPYDDAWRAHHLPGPPELISTTPGGIFSGYLQLAMMTGLVAAAPIIFYQLWAFISPGLYSKEKRLIVPFVFFSTALFLSGVAFGYFIAFPVILNYFFSLLGPMTADGAVLMQRTELEKYLDFATRILLACGGIFELPLLMAFLAIAGIVTPQQLLRFWRWAVPAPRVVGAIISPGPDVSSQIVMSAPLVLLYFISVGVAFLVARKPKKV